MGLLNCKPAFDNLKKAHEEETLKIQKEKDEAILSKKKKKKIQYRGFYRENEVNRGS